LLFQLSGEESGSQDNRRSPDPCRSITIRSALMPLKRSRV
jgi:hypothetical protein